MATANYSTYNRRASAVKKKPAAKPAPKLSMRVGASITSKPKSAPKSIRPLVKPPAAPVTPVMPAAPKLQAVPTVPMATGPAPQTLSSNSDRISIREGYGAGVNDINRNILNAAMAYGGVDNAQQFGYDPTGQDLSNHVGVTHNAADNSALSVIARNQAAVGKNIDETAGAENTFFSSNRLHNLQDTNNEADRQRIQAKKDYDDAMAGYMSSLMSLRTDRDTGLRNADIADIMAAQANAPENLMPAPEAPVSSPAPGITAAQSSLHNTPRVVPGQDSHGNAGDWHIYPDGHKVFVRKR